MRVVVVCNKPLQACNALYGGGSLVVARVIVYKMISPDWLLDRDLCGSTIQLRTLISGSTSTPVPKIVMPPTRNGELMSRQPSTRPQRPTLQFSARIEYEMQARSLISVPSSMIECLMRTPWPMRTPLPIVTLGPIWYHIHTHTHTQRACRFNAMAWRRWQRRLYDGNTLALASMMAVGCTITLPMVWNSVALASFSGDSFRYCASSRSLVSIGDLHGFDSNQYAVFAPTSH
jgi:hypothetical protein